MSIRIVGLGDSVGFGVGDAGAKFIGPSWAGRLAHHLETDAVANFALPGARSRNLLEQQLPAAVNFGCDLALISIGGNDVLRSDFNATRIEDDVRVVATKLSESGALCHVMGLPNPLRTSPLPHLIKRALARRAWALNVSLARACKDSGAIFIHTWNREAVYTREFWHVDRMHPSPVGYEYLTQISLKALNVNAKENSLPVSHDENAPHRIIWLLLFGSIWFIRRSKDLLPRLLWLTLLETRDVAFRKPLNFTHEELPAQLSQV